MKKTYLLGGGIAVLTAAILAGCNGNDDDGAPAAASTTQVTITPSLGKILGAKVIARNAVTGATLGSGTTDSVTGIAKFTAQKTTSPVVIEVQGTDGAQGATYYDEASNANVPLPATKKIRAIAPSLGDTPNFGVTVLTDLAYQAAVKAAGTEAKVNTADIVNQANNQIKALLAKELGTNSLLTPPTIIGKDTIVKNVITAKNAANDYALKLAALANLGSSENGARALDVLAKLSDDISDGSLDGKKGTVGVSYSHDTSSFNAALDSYLANYVSQMQLNTVYTAQVLSSFNIVNGSVVITVSGTGGGTGSGQDCMANIAYTGLPVIGSMTYKVCYSNFPQNAVCGSGNSTLAGLAQSVQVPGAAGGGTVTVNYTFSSVANCASSGANVTVNYAN
ncbi:MAG: hypothetical protein Q7S87_07650 [Agitococcus sp.]|nr:hypothetical protein [Agitococcus sp.]